ncbi:hypothetical protein OVA29_17475 [Exiguobacterium sp. SL14]|nr:hypothetical protein [Exiguobacterium sp. SL14]MCY1692160.1 hypothetical protein [Exiguobacterium sp. SL14]
MKRDQFPLGVIALQVMTGFLTAVMTTLLFLSTRQVDWHVLFVLATRFPCPATRHRTIVTTAACNR